MKTNHPITRRTFLESAASVLAAPELVNALSQLDAMNELTQNNREMKDVAIIGGSYAGLAAALQLGRAIRTVDVYDTGLPRNRFAKHSHGFLGQDGRKPVDILSDARNQLEPYTTVQLKSALVTDVSQSGGNFTVSVEGQASREYRKVILATGVSDQLPSVNGLRELWGGSVFHCPYCHGYEVRGQRLAVLGSGEVAVHQVSMLRDWSKDVVLLANGEPLSEEHAAILAKLRVRVVPHRISRFLSENSKLVAVELEGADSLPRDAILTASITHPAGEYWKQLGCKLEDTPIGSMFATSPMKETSVSGVFAAGDAARAPHSVTFAVADGAMAGIACHRSLLMDLLDL
jgi:thioredoxin reductase